MSRVPSVFASADDDEADAPAQPGRAVARPSFPSHAALLVPRGPASSGGVKSFQERVAEQEVAKALTEDASIFDYDGWHETGTGSTSRRHAPPGAPAPAAAPARSSRYISSLLDRAKERDVERDLRRERQLEREEAAEDGPVEHYVSDASVPSETRRGERGAGSRFGFERKYKARLEERRRLEEEERLKALAEDAEDASKKGGSLDFIRHLRMGAERPAPVPPAPASQPALAPVVAQHPAAIEAVPPSSLEPSTGTEVAASPKDDRRSAAVVSSAALSLVAPVVASRPPGQPWDRWTSEEEIEAARARYFARRAEARA